MRVEDQSLQGRIRITLGLGNALDDCVQQFLHPLACFG